MDVSRLAAAISTAGSTGGPVFRYGVVTAYAGGVATVEVAGGTVAGVPAYCAGVAVGVQVLMVAQGADLVIIGVKQ